MKVKAIAALCSTTIRRMKNHKISGKRKQQGFDDHENKPASLLGTVT